MPNFEFTSPQGKMYTISGPDGSTQSQAFAILQQQLGIAQRSSSDDIPQPAGAAQRMAVESRAPEEKTFLTDSLRDKLYGPADAAMAIASSVDLGAVAPIVGFAKSAISGGDPEKIASDFAEQNQFQPRTGTGRQLAELAGNILAPLGALPTSELANLHSAISSIRAPLGQAGSAIADGIRESNAAINASDASSKAALAESGGGKIIDMFRKKQAADAISSGPQSAGAAASQHANMAEASGASPEIQSIISNAEQDKDIHALAAERHAEASSLPVSIDLTAGEAMGDAAKMSDERNSRGKYPEIADFYDDREKKLVENFDEIRNQVAPDVAARGVDLDQMAVDAYKVMDAPVRADISTRYKALENGNGGEFPLNGKDFVNAADSSLKKANRTRFVPPEVQGILNDLREGGPMTFNDFESYRTILAEQSRKAERAGDGTASHAINLIRDSLESLPMTEQSADIKVLADSARNAARDRFQKIDRDPAYKAAVNDDIPLGEPSPIADGFIKKYVLGTTGKTANVENMMRNLAGDPLNRQIIAAGMVDHLKGLSGIDLRTNTGNISQAALNKAIIALDKKADIVMGNGAVETTHKLGNVAAYTMKQSKGSFVNNSATETAKQALMQRAKDVIAGAADKFTFQATRIAREVELAKTEKEAMMRSFQPGAGVKLSDFPEVQAKVMAKQKVRMPGPPTRTPVMPSAIVTAPTINAAIAAAQKAV